MGNSFCVGGLVLQNNTLVRLINPGGYNQPNDTPLEVGGVWDINFVPRPDVIPPHVEDVIVQNKTFVGNQANLSTFLLTLNLDIWHGAPTNIFDGALHWTGSGRGYVNDPDNLPNRSVGFWISDRSLTFDGHHYIYPPDNAFQTPNGLKYVGHSLAVPTIPHGTLMRVSLARWWAPDDVDIERRCYLQQSGWYL